jgi:hypothetical protein
MSHRPIVKPPKESPYHDAYQLACETLKDATIRERADKSGAILKRGEQGKYLLTLTFLNRRCEIEFPEITILYPGSQEEVPLWSKIILLHYLIKAQGVPLSGKWINFRQVPGGEGYYPAFVRRSQTPLCDFFNDRLEWLEASACALGGERAPYGDRAVVIPALPRVPIALVFWRGDEEFGSEVTILFDETIPCYLSTEDIAVLSQHTVGGLITWVKRKSGIMH